MTIAMIDTQNDCSFAVRFTNEACKEKVKKYMDEGLSAWYCAAHVPVDYEGEYFTKDEVESFYDAGYAEPTSELLTKEGIEHEIVDIIEDEDGNIVNADEIFCY